MGEGPGSGPRRTRARSGSLPTMRVRPVDWLLSGSTVGLGLGLLVAPVALTPSLSSLYALHGALEGASALSRWMLSPSVPPLMAAGPVAAAVYCTATRMVPRRRRAVLALALAVTLAATALFARGLVAPLLSVASGAP